MSNHFRIISSALIGRHRGKHFFDWFTLAFDTSEILRLFSRFIEFIIDVVITDDCFYRFEVVVFILPLISPVVKHFELW